MRPNNNQRTNSTENKNVYTFSLWSDPRWEMNGYTKSKTRINCYINYCKATLLLT